MRKFPIFALLLLVVGVVGGGGGYLLGRSHAPSDAGRAEADQPLQYLRNQVIRSDGSTSRSDGNAEQVCLEFNKPLAEGGAKLVTVTGVATPDTRVREHEVCVGGWAKDAAKAEIAIAPGLKARDGSTIAKEIKLSVDLKGADRDDLTVAQRSLVAFAGAGFILPQIGATGVAIETRNVGRLRVRVFRVTDTKLVREWPKRRPKKADDAADDDGFRFDNPLSHMNTGSGYVVWDGSMEVENRGDETVTTTFPLSRILPERRPGAYLIAAEPDAAAADRRYYWDYGNPATRWVIETDIGLALFEGEDGYRVLARSYDTAKPLSGIDMELVAENGAQLAHQATDADGMVRFDRPLLAGQGAHRPFAIYAYAPDGSFALLDVNRPAFDLSDRGVSGKAALRPISAFAYADRGIYRPGETVQLSAMMRRDTADMLDTPVTLVVQRPNGAEYRRMTLKPDAGGGVHLGVQLPASAARGVWNALVFADPTDRPVGRLSFDVQDFVPQRLEVRGVASTPTYDAAQPPQLVVNAAWLYGAPAAELQGFGEVRIAPDPTPFAAWRGWRFGRHDDPFENAQIKAEAGATDKDGKLSLQLPVAKIESSWPLKATVEYGIYEPGGRPTAGRVVLPVHHRDSFFAIKPEFDDNRVANGGEAVLKVAAVDDGGRQIARAASWRLEREIWDYAWYRDDGRGRWTFRTTIRLQPLQSGEWSIAADRPQELRFATKPWERYRLTVEDKDGTAASYRFAAGFASSSPDDEIPDKVAVAAEKTSYKPGDTARIAIKSAAAGEAIVAVATNRILWTRHVSLPAGGTTIDVPVTADWGAGAYVMVDAVRPLNGGSAREPVRSIGLAWVPIDNTARTLSVAMTLPEVAVPQQKITVPVAISGLARGSTTFVTVAAVDEGILALTGFASPDPAEHYFGKRRLGVDLRDDYGRLLDGQAAAAGRTRHGGDAGGDGGPGLTTVPTRTVALFSGPVEVDAEGRATVAFELPDFVGQLRLMAVAYNKGQVGHGDARIRVRYPLVADAYFPRFLAPGDTAQMTLFVQNVDAAPGEYTFNLTAEGSTAFTREARLVTPLAARESRSTQFELAAAEIGIGTVRLQVAGPDGLAFAREWRIETRSPHAPMTLESRTTLDAGESISVSAKFLDPFLPGTGKASVNVSAIAGIDVAGLLQSLYRYPYGCTEQTTSVAVPLLAFDDFRMLGTVSTGEAQEIRKRVQQAVDTILDRQSEDGAIGLWRAGDGMADGWLVAYAIDFLLQARDRGYTVPEDAFERSRKFLLALARGDNESLTIGLYGYEPARVVQRTAQAYAHYLLARLGQPQRDLLLRALPEIARVRSGGATTFATAALALIGERERAAGLLAEGIPLFQPARYVYYDSQIGQTAMTAALLTETMGPAAARPYLERIERLAPSPQNMSPHQKAWLLRAASALKRNTTLRIAENGVERSATDTIALSFTPTAEALAAGYTIANLSTDPVGATIILRGAPRYELPAVSQGYRLIKTVHTPDGTAIDPAAPGAISRHDKLVVVLEGKVDDLLHHQSVIADLLPAGWEIEGVLKPPRKQDDPALPSWLGNLSAALTIEARDDRFVAAFDLNQPSARIPFFFFRDRDDDDVKSRLLPPGETFRFAYVVRAVTPGSFALPEAVVEDMYRPEKMARTAASVTHVGAR